MLSAPGFHHWLRSQKKENELAEKDSTHLFLGGKRKPLLRPLQLRSANWGKAQEQRECTAYKYIQKARGRIREKKPLQHAHMALETSYL